VNNGLDRLRLFAAAWWHDGARSLRRCVYKPRGASLGTLLKWLVRRDAKVDAKADKADDRQ
jgi:hypothetical protein